MPSSKQLCHHLIIEAMLLFVFEISPLAAAQGCTALYFALDGEIEITQRGPGDDRVVVCCRPQRRLWIVGVAICVWALCSSSTHLVIPWTSCVLSVDLICGPSGIRSACFISPPSDDSSTLCHLRPWCRPRTLRDLAGHVSPFLSVCVRDFLPI